MSLEKPFAAAQEKVKTLTSRPDNKTLLELYSLYKQGSVGDVEGERPGMVDFAGRAKYDAWAKLRGTPRDEARKRYIALVDRLLEE